MTRAEAIAWGTEHTLLLAHARNLPELDRLAAVVKEKLASYREHVGITKAGALQDLVKVRRDELIAAEYRT